MDDRWKLPTRGEAEGMVKVVPEMTIVGVMTTIHFGTSRDVVWRRRTGRQLPRLAESYIILQRGIIK